MRCEVPMALQADAPAPVARRPSVTVTSPSALRFPKVHCVPRVSHQPGPMAARSGCARA